MSLTLVLLVWMVWYSMATPSPFLIIRDHWRISLTMAFGSLIAGATSEGGGAVAFPVFTKVLHIAPFDAKVFALAIQSIGMTTASLVIIAMGIQVEWRVIRWATVGGFPGIFLGSAIFSPLFPADMVRLLFTAMVSSFAFTLFIVNRNRRVKYKALLLYGNRERMLLMMAGFMGGILSGLVGSGIDIVTFSLIVLLFRIAEKVATPTSVIVMAVNAIIGFLLHYYVIGGFTPEVKTYWLAAVPVVVLGAPLGAFLCSLLSNRTIAWILISLITVEFITTLILIPLNVVSVISSLSVFSFFFTLYYVMYRSRVYVPIMYQEK